MRCGKCEFWQGNKYSKWGDCHRVIEQFGSFNQPVPFDPHDVKYHRHDSEWMRMYKNSLKEIQKKAARSPKHIRIRKEREDDILINKDGGEYEGKWIVYYIQTKRNCKAKCYGQG